jgi:uncharacterized LabA/DUF88 family protein
MDIEISVDMMELAPSVDHIVLFSGDGDFRRLVESVQRRGRRVSVVSSLRTQPAMVSDDLRRQADHFIELVDLQPLIAREGVSPRQSNHERAERAPQQNYVPQPVSLDSD